MEVATQRPDQDPRGRRPDGAEARAGSTRISSGSSNGSSRRRGRAHARRLPRVRPLGLRLLQPRGGPGARRPDRRPAGAQGDRGLRASTGATASSACWSGTASGSSTRACWPVPMAWSAPIARSICRSWGSTCSSTRATGRSRSTTRAASGSGCISAMTARSPRRRASCRCWAPICWSCRRTGRPIRSAPPST